LKSKLPERLLDAIINRPRYLIIFINPPYAESAGMYTLRGKEGRVDIGNNLVKNHCNEILGKASKELFAQFIARIYKDIPTCKLGVFSKLKAFSSVNFNSYRQHFLARFINGFVVPGNTFDNVVGNFPIAFQC